MSDGWQALSIRQPWAWLIIRGHKDVENRNWETQVRGWVLVHASSTKASKWCWSEAALFAAKRGAEIPPCGAVPLGCVVGAMRIDDCVTRCMSPWFVGDVGFVIGKVVAFAQPVPVPGSLGFFRIPPASSKERLEIKTAIAAQLRLAGLGKEFDLDAS